MKFEHPATNKEDWGLVARNVDLPTNPDFDGVEVADADVHPGPIMVLDEIIRIALDDDGDKQDLRS